MLEDDEDMVNIFDTDWYREISSSTTPGEVLRIYRENGGFTQEEPGRKPGSFRFFLPSPVFYFDVSTHCHQSAAIC